MRSTLSEQIKEVTEGLGSAAAQEVPQPPNYVELLLQRIDQFEQWAERDLAAHRRVRAWLQEDPNAKDVVEALFSLVSGRV